MRAHNPALLVFRKCQDFQKLFVAGPTEKIVLGHDFLPVENSGSENPILPSCWRQLAPCQEANEQETRLIGVEYEAVMRGRSWTLVLSITLLSLAGGIATRARDAGQEHASDQLLSERERARLLAAGKELFLARCARCHDERGDKPLKTGPPLNERGLSSEQIARAVSGRLRDKTEEERRAVTLYISSLMKAKDSEEKAPPKP
jgi:mono/diheme cytochrome c family protein